MNELANVRWSAIASSFGAHDFGPMPARFVADMLLEEGGLEGFDLRDLVQLAQSSPDADMDRLLDDCHLAVIKHPGVEPGDDGEEAAVPAWSGTWLEEHDLDDGRLLVLPNDGDEDRNISFWRRGPDGRLGVVSFLSDSSGRLTGALLRLSKVCQEEYDAGVPCLEIVGGCKCEERRRRRGGVGLRRCVCRSRH